MSDLQNLQARIESLIGKRALATGVARDRITTQMRRLRCERDLLILAMRDARAAR